MKTALAWILGGIFGFAVFYVAYAHVASIVSAPRYLEQPSIKTFGENDTGLSLRTEGSLLYTISGGELHVSAETRGPSHLEWLGPVRALEEGSYTMRFKAAKQAEYDVVLGLESADGKHFIRYGLRNERFDPGYTWDGDALSPMPGVRGKPLPGEDIDAKSRFPFGASDLGDWHEITLQLSPSLHRMTAFVDGVPTGSVLTEWLMGMPVRMVFGVHARKTDQNVDVSIARVSWEPGTPEAHTLRFDDRFDGKVIDPRRWAVHSFESDVLSASLKTTKEGLSTNGHGTPQLVKGSAAFMLDTPAFPLADVYVKTKISVRQLDHGSFFVGVTSALGGPHLRFFDTGVHSVTDAPAGARPYVGMVSGHWGRDAQARFDPARHWADSDDITIEIEIDGKTRVARAKMDGNVIGEHVTDLQPSENVRVRFGVYLDDAEAKFDLTVRELELRAE